MLGTLLLVLATAATPDPAEVTCSGLLAPNEPMYLVAGAGDARTARLQLSFEHGLFCRDGDAARQVSWLERVYLGYTQTTLWDLSSDSRPFRDNTFRPSVYWQHFELQDGTRPDFLRGGYEHESNGRADAQSRSLNVFFVQAGWVIQHGEQRLTIAPKLRIPLSESTENRDIDDFRGYVDLHVRYGRDDGWLVAATIRRGNHGFGSLQLEASYPLQMRAHPRAGTFLYVQAFHGYGETLLDYNVKSDIQLRVGLAIIR